MSFLEFRTAAITHCADSSLHGLDVVHNRLLEASGMDTISAFLALNLAPLGVRRDIANLGIIYRAISGLGPVPLQSFFFLSQSAFRTSPRRHAHRFQLEDTYRSLHRDYLNRSLLGYVAVFNLLPDSIFSCTLTGELASVKTFRSNLVLLLRSCVEMVDWPLLFSPRVAIFQHPLLQVS